MISILTGIGAGALGFASAWYFIQNVLHRDPHIGHDALLVTAIFLPGALIPLLTFRAVSIPVAPAAPAR